MSIIVYIYTTLISFVQIHSTVHFSQGREIFFVPLSTSKEICFVFMYLLYLLLFLYETENTAIGIGHADHVAPSIRKS
jgi:hypothetical protein